MKLLETKTIKKLCKLDDLKKSCNRIICDWFISYTYTANKSLFETLLLQIHVLNDLTFRYLLEPQVSPNVSYRLAPPQGIICKNEQLKDDTNFYETVLNTLQL